MWGVDTLVCSSFCCWNRGWVQLLFVSLGQYTVSLKYFQNFPICGWFPSSWFSYPTQLAHFRSPRWGYLLWRSQLYECYYMYIKINAIRGFSYIFYTRLTQFSPKMEVKRSSLNPTFLFFLCHPLLIPFSLSAQWQMASPSPPGEASLCECGRMSITGSHVMALANDVPAIWAWHQSWYVTHPVLPLRCHTAPSSRLGWG